MAGAHVTLPPYFPSYHEPKPISGRRRPGTQATVALEERGIVR